MKGDKKERNGREDNWSGREGDEREDVRREGDGSASYPGYWRER